jgi:hypothetical protein
LFCGFWFDAATGAKLGRATRQELASAYRLWARHADIRGAQKGIPNSGDPFDRPLEDVVANELDQLGLDSLGAA